MTSLQPKGSFTQAILWWYINAIFAKLKFNANKSWTCLKLQQYHGDKSHWKLHLVYMCDFEFATLVQQKLHWVAEKFQDKSNSTVKTGQVHQVKPNKH